MAPSGSSRTVRVRIVSRVSPPFGTRRRPSSLDSLRFAARGFHDAVSSGPRRSSWRSRLPLASRACVFLLTPSMVHVPGFLLALRLHPMCLTPPPFVSRLLSRVQSRTQASKEGGRCWSQQKSSHTPRRNREPSPRVPPRARLPRTSPRRRCVPLPWRRISAPP